MAIGSVGTLGTGASGTSGNSLAFNTTAALEVGNVGLLIIASDNIQTTDGSNGLHSGVTDAAGNTYTKLGEWTNGEGAAAAGCTVSLWMVKATTQLNSGASVTISFSNNITDKSCSFWEFTASNDLQVASGPNANTTDGAEGYGSVTISGLTSKQYLFIRALAKEVNSNTNITPSTNFTAVSSARSRNNAAAICVRGEFRINTSTGETSNPVHASAGDTVGMFFALEEVTAIELTAGAAGVEASATAPTTTVSGISVSAGIAGVEASALNPTLSLGTLTVVAGIAVAEASVFAPGISQSGGGPQAGWESYLGMWMGGMGSPPISGLTLSAGIASIQATAIAPTVSLGEVTVVVGTALAETTVTAPSVTLGTATLTAGVALVQATAVDPQILTAGFLGAGIAEVQVSVTAPTMTLGGITVTAGTALATAAAVNATISLGAAPLTAGVVTVEAQVAAPSVTVGSVTLAAGVATTQTTATAPTILLGPITVVAGQVLANTLVTAPAVNLGSITVVAGIANVEISLVTPTAQGDTTHLLMILFAAGTYQQPS